MKQQIDELMSRQMDRRDFLKHLGIGMLALFGAGAAMKALSSLTRSPQKTTTNMTRPDMAYGGGAYGGKRTV